jgi:hypothetical protein
MPNPGQRITRGGPNRAGLAPAGRARAKALVSRSAAPSGGEAAPRPAVPPESTLPPLLTAALHGAALAAGLALLLLLAYLTRDSIAIGKHLAAARNERTTLVCQNGRMTHGDGSLYDRVFEKSYFVCTDWRTLQAIELNEKPR